MKTIIAVLLLTACVDEPTPSAYSCVILTRCAGAEDIIARESLGCYADETEASDRAHELGWLLLEERCPGAGSWTRVVCAPRESACSLAVPSEAEDPYFIRTVWRGDFDFEMLP